MAEQGTPAPTDPPTPPEQSADAAGGGAVDQALSDAQAAVDAMAGEVQSAGGVAGLTDTAERAGATSGGASGGAGVTSGGGGGIEMLGDVDLDVSIELGRTEMLVEDVLKLGPGAVVELDKLAGDPVDVRVNGRLVARGEVLVLNDNFCIRVSEIVADLEEQAEAARALQGAAAGDPA